MSATAIAKKGKAGSNAFSGRATLYNVSQELPDQLAAKNKHPEWLLHVHR